MEVTHPVGLLDGKGPLVFIRRVLSFQHLKVGTYFAAYKLQAYKNHLAQAY